MGSFAEMLRDVDRAIDRESEWAFLLLEELVRRPSVLGSELGAQEVLGDALAELGFDPEYLPVPDCVANDAFSGIPTLPYTDRYNLVTGATESTGLPSLLVNGHIDVVPAQERGWTSPPFVPRRRNGWMFGRGAGDMKAGFAMVVLGLKALRQHFAEAHSAPLRVLSVIEEECTGNGTLAALRAGVIADAVLLPEPTDLQIMVGGIGVTWVRVTIDLGGGHAGPSDRVSSPADLLSSLLASFRSLEASYNKVVEHYLETIEHPYNVNVGEVTMGDWPSSVPSLLTLGVRIGHRSDHSSEQVLQDVRACTFEALESYGSPVKVEIVPHGFRAEGYHLDPSHALVGALRHASAQAGNELIGTTVVGSTTDARYYINQAQIPAVCYGPVVTNMHGTDEAVELDSIVRGARTYARLFANYIHCDGLVGFGHGLWQ